MAKRGRPRKSGARNAAGHLSRAADAQCTERALAHKREYRGNGHDPVGRAYEKGLLGREGGRPSKEALDRLNSARSIYAAYWAMYGVGRVGCTLGDKSGIGRGLSANREAWLNSALERVGTADRAVFDELVLDGHFDSGPPWLDRLIRREGSDQDKVRLARAIAAIDRIGA